MSKEKVLIIDIDNTLTDASHRMSMLKEEGDHWSKFFQAMAGDSLNVWCKELIDGMHSNYGILLVTGRPSNYRDITVEWLKSKGVNFDGLYMRAEGDRRPDYVVKKEIYCKYIQDTFDVLFVVDDRKTVVDMWRSLGLTVLHCAVGDY
jgi:3-deoxy-D-manno-octulosonate 8-phosphate phosphatase KdsC-like HAD superfamily phosphatase